MKTKGREKNTGERGCTKQERKAKEKEGVNAAERERKGKEKTSTRAINGNERQGSKKETFFERADKTQVPSRAKTTECQTGERARRADIPETTIETQEVAT